MKVKIKELIPMTVILELLDMEAALHSELAEFERDQYSFGWQYNI